jgi:hypothetical protein
VGNSNGAPLDIIIPSQSAGSKMLVTVTKQNYYRYSYTVPVVDPNSMLLSEPGSLLNFQLSQNYPNPFNPITNIKFSIPKTDHVKLQIYNLLGEVVATLVAQKLSSGNYKYSWNATGFASGIYYYRLVTESGYEMNRKLVLLK